MALTSFVDYSLEDIKDVENKSTKKESVEKRSYSVEALVETSKMIHYMTNKGVSEDFDLYNSSLEHLNDYIIHRGKDGYAGFNQSEARLMNIARHYTAGALGMEVNPKSAGSLESDANEIIQYSVEEASSENKGIITKIKDWILNLITKVKDFFNKSEAHIEAQEEKLDQVKDNLQENEKHGLGKAIKEVGGSLAEAAMIKLMATSGPSFLDPKGEWGEFIKECNEIIKQGNAEKMGGLKTKIWEKFGGSNQNAELTEEVKRQISDKLIMLMYGNERTLSDWCAINTMDSVLTFRNVASKSAAMISAVKSYEFGKKFKKITGDLISEFKNSLKPITTDSATLKQDVMEGKILEMSKKFHQEVKNALFASGTDVSSNNKSLETLLKDKIKSTGKVGKILAITPGGGYLLFIMSNEPDTVEKSNRIGEYVYVDCFHEIGKSQLGANLATNKSNVSKAVKKADTNWEKHANLDTAGKAVAGVAGGVVVASLFAAAIPFLTVGLLALATGGGAIGFNVINDKVRKAKDELKLDADSLVSIFDLGSTSLTSTINNAYEDIKKVSTQLRSFKSVIPDPSDFEDSFKGISELMEQTRAYAANNKDDSNTNSKVINKLNNYFSKMLNAFRLVTTSYISSIKSLYDIMVVWVNYNTNMLVRQANILNTGSAGKDVNVDDIKDLGKGLERENV